MDHSAKDASPPDRLERMKNTILTKLESSRKQFPGRFPIPIHVLMPVDLSIDGTWEQRLREVEQNHEGKRVLLIPCHVVGLHWIGIVLKFNDTGELRYAECVDALRQSGFNLSELQEQFVDIFPRILLQSRKLQDSEDVEKSAELTVDNLLQAAAEYSLIIVRSSDVNNSNGNTSNDSRARNTGAGEDSNPSNSSVLKGNRPERQSNRESEKVNIQNVPESSVPVPSRERTSDPDAFFTGEHDASHAGTDQARELEVSITEESLSNMYKNFNRLPICSERFILSLLCHISFKLADDNARATCGIEVPEKLEDEMMRECECLKERLKIEEVNSTAIDSELEKCSIHLRNANWKAALAVVKLLWKQRNPLDIPELFRLVEKVDDAAKLIKGKDVFLFLGRTGVGKSTTIHFLGGSRMVQTTVNGLNHIAPTEIKNSALENVKSAPFAQSVTRYIEPVEVNFGDVGGYKDGSIVLCDSPGFEDMNGPEVDIANGIGIVKAIKGCKSVKPVVLISFKSIGDRCDGVKDLAHAVVGLIPGIQDHLRSFSYLFTKFPSEEKATVHDLLKDVNKRLREEEKLDISFTNILKDMLQKTRRNPRVLDPIHDDPGEILDELADSVCIENPDEVFHFSITDTSKSVVREQVRKHQLNIISGTKRSDYSFVQYKLDQLKELNELLHQDEIEQIYQESIRFVSKHLLEEYQVGTAAMDGCLVKQMTLKDEEIQQYRTRIEHSIMAEPLRSRHLGKEVVRSDAFIQFLNQQMDTICVTLRGKDIDDSLVKVSLDNMKLLSKYFPSADSRYETACRLFSEKLDCVITSFYASVESNQFTDSASYMTKLDESRNILENRVGCQDIEAKYERLKDYFLTYLHESVTKLEDIFTQGKLVESHVQNLNRCVLMLESVTHTYALHSHISDKVLNQIYESILAKIETHFRGIVKKVDFETKKENAFTGLEQYMTELDSIRKISGIELRTSELYFSTLEKLIGYVHEARRETEQLLSDLFRREKKVDIDRLTKNLMSLKSAKWIEKYRTDVYSDVIAQVEGQILEHIKQLKESVKGTNLDLDKFDKIDIAHKIVSEINEMKHLEKFAASVNEPIDEVNEWFIEATGKVFAMVKDTFDTKKWEERRYQSLDFDKIHKALKYLKNCSDIRMLFKSNLTPTLNSLEEFVRCFSSYVQTEMLGCFDRIKKYQGENHEKLLEDTRSFARRLKEISEIKTKYKSIFDLFSNQEEIQQWPRELSEHVIELSSDMASLSRTNRTDILSIRLSLAKALSKLDGFLEEKKYIDLHQEYHKMLFSQTDNVCQQVIDAITKHDYQKIAFAMTALKSSDRVGEHFFEQARRAVNIGLSDFMDETKNAAILLGDNMDKEILPIVDNLKRLQKAKQFVSGFLDSPDDMEKCTTEVKQLMNARIKRYIAGVRALITVNNFYEADRRIDSITLVRSFLGSFCTEDLSNEIEALKTSQNDVVLTDLVKRYSEMDISSYTLHPPSDIFAKFAQVNNTNPVYHQAYNTIKEAIFSNLRKELEVAKSKQPPNPENIHIRKFESAVKYLPADMREHLEAELKHCKEDIERAIRDNDTRFDDACKSSDLKSMKAMLKECKTSEGMKPYLNKSREFVLLKLQDLVKKIKESFEQQDIAGALLNVKILHEYKVEFEDSLTDIRQPCKEVSAQIKNVFEEAYLCFVNRFLESNASIVTDDAVQAVEKSFLCLMELLKFSRHSEYRDIAVVTDMFPEDFQEKLKALNEHLVRYFIEHQKRYTEAFVILDVTALKDVLDVAKGWHLLHTKMISYHDRNQINDDTTRVVVKVMSGLTLYPQVCESIAQRIAELGKKLLNQPLINEETKEFEKRRDEFYRELNENLTIVSKAKAFSKHKITCADQIEQECLKSLDIKITSISSNADEILNKFLLESKLSKPDCDTFNLYYKNMISYHKEMKVMPSENAANIAKLEKKAFERIEVWQRAAENGQTLDIFVKSLINIKRVSNYFPTFKQSLTERIDDMLVEFKNAKKDSTAFSKLGALLNQDEAGVGQRIVAEHKAFQGFSLSLFNEKTQKHGIDYVLKNLTGDLIDRILLQKRYKEFRDLYDSLIRQYLKADMKYDALIADTKQMAGDTKQKPDVIDWDATVRSKVQKLAAHIFALWTLQNSQHFFEADSTDNRDSYLLQPHAAQVISIFRMLGIGDTKEELNHNLVQIGTGEGKSITLGVTASILALLGFDVCCACYSEYLSQRDYAAFVSLFDSLGVGSYIHYGTFNKLCEYVINENGNIRDVVEEVISKDVNIAVQNAKNIKRAKILLIDEVDVFFSRDFYGNVYTPSSRVRDPAIVSLANVIWAQKTSKLNLNKVKEKQEYKDCCDRFPKWIALIDEAIKDMVSDVVNFESHTYIVKEDKIGYIEQDNVVYNVTYGYQTMFAYYLEHENGRISTASRNANIYIRIKCGSFSYAETPLQFQYIMGVTGTLVILSDPEKEIIEKAYKIKKNTISPSVFGQNNLRFVKKDDIRIETSDDYHNVIRREIDDKLAGGQSGKRAVLVFFESEKKLKEFYESKALESIKESVVYLTEEASSSEKDNLIKRATGSGQITLFTRTFGRGTDFVCHDPAVSKSGGIHVIQAFLSEEVSEEVQIKGRTARQGDYGSYSMILLDRDLEKFHIDIDQIENVKIGRSVTNRLTSLFTSAKIYDSMYDFLNEMRTIFFKTQYAANTKYVEQAKERHKIGQQFLTSLQSGDIASLKAFLIQENKGVESISVSRTVCLMDATGSMSHLLQKCKNTVNIMFERASAILKENDISTDTFQLQFVVYRNYCCRENMILQNSPWETKPDNLRAFMSTINVAGGLGNEAIEIGLWHANKEYERDEISQVILIGDIAPNTQAEVTQRRQIYGEKYWSTTQFAQSTYYVTELARLIVRKIPVHTFFVAKEAEHSFRDIAQQTGGRCESLDINSLAGSEMLTNLVTEEILRNVGGTSKGNALVEAYRNRFAKTYA